MNPFTFNPIYNPPDHSPGLKNISPKEAELMKQILDEIQAELSI